MHTQEAPITARHLGYHGDEDRVEVTVGGVVTTCSVFEGWVYVADKLVNGQPVADAALACVRAHDEAFRMRDVVKRAEGLNAVSAAAGLPVEFVMIRDAVVLSTEPADAERLTTEAGVYGVPVETLVIAEALSYLNVVQRADERAIGERIDWVENTR